MHHFGNSRIQYLTYFGNCDVIRVFHAYEHTWAHIFRLETHCCASPSMNNSLFLPLSSSPHHTHIFTDSALHYDAVINQAINRALYSERHRDPRHMTWPSNSPANTGNIRRIIGRICKKTTLAHSYRQLANLSKYMHSVEHTEKPGRCRENIR